MGVRKKAAEALKKKAQEAGDTEKAAKHDLEIAAADEEAAQMDVEDEEFGEPEPVAGDPPRVTDLTAEEKATKFFNHAVPDLQQFMMNTQFMNFSLPGSDEGF